MATDTKSSPEITIAGIVTPEILDELFELRFPWPKDSKLDIRSVNEWGNNTPAPVEQKLFDLAWPVLHKLTAFELRSKTTIVEHGLSALPEPSHPKYLKRALAFIMLVDQCPRMFHAQSTNARWTSAFFDPLAQHVVWHLIDKGHLTFQRWSALEYGFDHYLIQTSLAFSSADHSERLERHNKLHEINRQRRAAILERTGQEDPFAERLKHDGQDIFAFSRWIRGGLPVVDDVFEYTYLRSAIIDIHYPVIERFGRYPWRNSSIARGSTDAEIDFLEETNHFGEVDAASQAQIKADVDAGKWTSFI